MYEVAAGRRPLSCMQETETLRVMELTIEIVVGLMGLAGIVATIVSIYSARGPRERAHAAGTGIGAWIVFLLAMTAIYFLTAPWRYLVLVAYVVHLPFALYLTIRRRLLIRVAEERHIADLQDASGERTMGP